jgi:hypothetical protein
VRRFPRLPSLVELPGGRPRCRAARREQSSSSRLSHRHDTSQYSNPFQYKATKGRENPHACSGAEQKSLGVAERNLLVCTAPVRIASGAGPKAAAQSADLIHVYPLRLPKRAPGGTPTNESPSFSPSWYVLEATVRASALILRALISNRQWIPTQARVWPDSEDGQAPTRSGHHCGAAPLATQLRMRNSTRLLFLIF